MQNDIPMTFLCISENRNRKYNSNMADVRFLKLVVVISQPWIRNVVEIWYANRGARIICSRGRGQIQRCTFVSSKMLTTFLVVTLNTQVFIVTTNAKNTLQHFHRGGGK